MRFAHMHELIHVLRLLLVMFTGVTALVMNVQAQIVPGAVGIWHFDEGSGNTAADSSAGNRTITLFNTVAWTPGRSGTGITTNGTNQYGAIPALDLSGTNAVTVAVWVNRTYTTTGGKALIEATANYNNSTTGFGVFPDDNSCAGIMAAIKGNVGYSVNCYNTPTSGAWHHLAFVFDTSKAGNAETALYIDGVAQAAKSNLLVSNNTNNFGNNPIYLMSRGGVNEFAAGSLDELLIYNRALTPSEIQQLFASGTATLSSIAVTPANPSIAKGLTQQFTATGTYSDGSTQNITSSVTWSSSVTSTATINSAGLASAANTGSTTIGAASGSVSGSTLLTVTPATLVSISVTPANSSIVKGSTQQFTATGTFTDGSTQNLTGSATWSSTNTNTATIASGGLATGANTGSTSIRATSGAITGSTNLTVTLALTSIAVTPANSSIAKGTTLQYTATGTYSDSSTQNITSSVTWGSSNSSAATISSGGLATGGNTGSTTISATQGAINGSTGLTVTPAILNSIAVTPANGSIVKGNSQQFTATGTYSDGSTQNLTATSTWSSSNTSAATISSSGLATGVNSGSTTIQATFGAVSGSTNLAVTTTLPGLIGRWNFDDGSGNSAADSSGGGHNASLFNGVTWTAGKSGTAVTTNGTNQYVSLPALDLTTTNAVTIAMWVNRAYSTNGARALLEASTNFNSSTTGFGFFPDDGSCAGLMIGVHGNVGYDINCFNQPSSNAWHHLAIIYDTSKPAGGESTLYVDGALQAPKSTLLSSNNTNNFGNNPIFLMSRGGVNEFTAATIDDLQIFNRALTAAEIQQIFSQNGGSPLIGITVTPTNPSISKGQTQQFTATGSYGDGGTQNITNVVTWTSANTGAATINGTGLATSVNVGSTTIQAASGSVSGSTGLTVTPPNLVSITVTPGNSTLVKGSTQQFTATGNYSDGSTQNLTGSVTWGSTNTNTATIDSGGLATGVNTGSTTITATSGAVSGTTGLTVTLALTSITVTPANPSINKGQTQQFTATGTYSDSSTANITNSVTWSSTTSAASINSAGLATGANVGSTTIRATSGATQGSTGLTVNPAVLMTIAVTPANASISAGATQQYTATGTYSDSSSQNITGSVTWSSLDTSVATIASNGLATGAGAGSTTIRAVSGSVTGSTGVTVVAGSFPWTTYDMWVDFEQVPIGGAPTAAQLAASTHGTAGTWDVSHANLTSISAAGEDPGHAVTSDPGTRGMGYNVTNGAESYITWNLPAARSTLSFGMWYKTGRPGAWVEGPHFITLYNGGNGNMMRLSDERSSFNNGRQIRVSPMDQSIQGLADDTWYWVTVKWVQNSVGQFSVYDSSLHLVGTTAFTDTFNVQAQAICIGNTSATSGESGEIIYFDDLIVDFSSKFPVLPKP